MQDQLCATLFSEEHLAGCRLDGEAAALRRPLPCLTFCLGVVEAAGDHLHLRCHQESGVEADTELANKAHIGLATPQLLNKVCSARACDAAEVLDELGLHHTDTVVLDHEGACVLVGPDAQLHGLGWRVALSEGQEAFLVTRVRGVGHELPQEDILVRVQGIDNDIHDLPNLCLELEGLDICLLCDLRGVPRAAPLLAPLLRGGQATGSRRHGRLRPERKSSKCARGAARLEGNVSDGDRHHSDQGRGTACPFGA
mmetsp:Transcript_66443/g.183954  ORF Transcript_66443/g.183954 Transcript_66443/m.183954 type:complete len:255 (+) Transcript_66443:1645-2409(+)